MGAILQYIQVSSLKYATGALFLTDYAKDQNFNNEIRVIPHGISEVIQNGRMIFMYQMLIYININGLYSKHLKNYLTKDIKLKLHLLVLEVEELVR